ncbi:TetR/AcrR family transcriptional regulator [Nocardia sp. NPDC057455]|uniref:TetR/AcrR family transcriptional regulator n=1 Tax=Nocardia sp. NPDC057455 TaxID=3346138 RepID=UPI00366A621D
MNAVYSAISAFTRGDEALVTSMIENPRCNKCYSQGVANQDPNRTDSSRRDELLRAALDDFARHGLVDFTLRRLADRIGTSARMLVHYFGGREQLLSAAFAEHRRQMRQQLTSSPAPSPAEAAASVWAAMTAVEQRTHFTVMYHLLAAGLTPDAAEHPAARDVILAWVDYAAELLISAGRDPLHARIDATALASGLKGILLDRLVTGDSQRCDAAARRLIDAVLAPPRTSASGEAASETDVAAPAGTVFTDTPRERRPRQAPT